MISEQQSYATVRDLLPQDRSDLKVWLEQSRKCLDNRRATPSYVEVHLLSLRRYRSIDGVAEVCEALERHLEVTKVRWSRRKR